MLAIQTKTSDMGLKMNKSGNFSVFCLIAVGLLPVSCASTQTGLMASNETKQEYHAAEIEEYLESLIDFAQVS